MLNKTLKERLDILRENSIIIIYESVIYSILNDYSTILEISIELLEKSKQFFNIRIGSDDSYYIMFLQELEFDFKKAIDEVREYELLLKAITKDSDLKFQIQNLGLKESVIREVINN